MEGKKKRRVEGKGEGWKEKGKEGREMGRKEGKREGRRKGGKEGKPKEEARRRWGGFVLRKVVRSLVLFIFPHPGYTRVRQRAHSSSRAAGRGNGFRAWLRQPPHTSSPLLPFQMGSEKTTVYKKKERKIPTSGAASPETSVTNLRWCDIPSVRSQRLRAS